MRQLMLGAALVAFAAVFPLSLSVHLYSPGLDAHARLQAIVAPTLPG